MVAHVGAIVGGDSEYLLRVTLVDECSTCVWVTRHSEIGFGAFKATMGVTLSGFR
jgi:hypothetical protein